MPNRIIAPVSKTDKQKQTAERKVRRMIANYPVYWHKIFVRLRDFEFAKEKTSESSKKQQTESSIAKSKIWTSIASTAAGVIVSLFSAVINSAELFRAPWAISAAIVTVLISAAFTALLAQRERGPSRVTNLKNKVHTAYLDAVNRSSLNPRPGEKL